jgi:hypothetical protein
MYKLARYGQQKIIGRDSARRRGLCPKGVTRQAKTSSYRKRRRNAREEHVGYLVRITGWDYYYSFRPSDPKSRWDPGPYNELATISFGGDIVRPQDSKYKRAKVTFSSRAGMMEENRAEPPKTIGSLTANDEELSAYIFIPAERVADLAVVAQSGRVQIVHFGATRLRYRSATVHTVSLSTEFDEEEW